QAIVTVLSLVNPLVCGAMFAQLETGQASATRLVDATRAALAVLVILVIATLVGARVTSDAGKGSQTTGNPAENGRRFVMSSLWFGYSLRKLKAAIVELAQWNFC